MIDLLLLIFIVIFFNLLLFVKIEWFFVLNFFAVIVMSALRVDPSYSIVSLFGIQLYMKDIFFISEMVFLVLFLAQQCIVNPKFFNSKYFQIPSLIFCIIILKIFFAFPTYGTMAFLESKHFLMFFGNILFFSIYPISYEKILSILKAIFYFSLIYTLVGILRYIDVLPSIYSNYLGSLSWATDFNTQRLFDRSDLEVLLIGSFYALSFLFLNLRNYSYKYLPAFSWLSLFILFSNTRSMIISFVFIFFYSFYLDKVLNFKKVIILFFIFLPVISIVVVLLPFLQISIPSFSYENLLGENSTFVFRNIVNLAYLNYMDFQSYFVGMTFADTPIVFPETYFNTIQGGRVGLHNAYIELVYYFGIPLMLFLLYLLISILKKLFYLRKNNKNATPINIMIMSIMSYVLIFMIWSFGQFSGIILGLSIALIKYFDDSINFQSLDRNI